MEITDAGLATRIAKILNGVRLDSQTRRLVEWYEKEKKNGLISVSVTCVEGVSNPELLDDIELAQAIEERAAEFMRMVNASPAPDNREL